jgi:PKD repeat protein
MSTNRTFIRSIIVLFTLNLSFLIAGCGGGGDGTIKTVDDDNVKTIDSTVTIEASPISGEAPLEVKFSVKSNDLILSASWNFGDGEAVEISPNNPTGPINPNSSIKHTFTEEGTYTVSVATETNSGGPQGDTIEITVGSGISFPVTKVFLSNFTPEEALTKVVGNSSVGDNDFNFPMTDSDTGEFILSLEPGETGFIEVKCDVSWELDVSITDVSSGDTRQDLIGMQLYLCGVDYEWEYFEL